MPHSKTSAVVIKAAIRHDEVLRLRIMGWTFAEIGNKMGCSRQKIHAIVQKQLGHIKAELSEKREHARILAAQQLDVLLKRWFPTALGKDFDKSEKATRILLQLMARKATLLGLDLADEKGKAEIANWVVNVQREVITSRDQVIEAQSVEKLLENLRDEEEPKSEKE